MSGVDDRRLDEILADGIQNQVCTLFSYLRSLLFDHLGQPVPLVNKPAQSMKKQQQC